MTVKTSAVILTHGRTDNFMQEGLQPVLLNINTVIITKQKFTLTAEAGELCNRATVLTQHRLTTNKQPK